MTTLFQQHKEKWKNCSDCDLCETRKKVVLARGVIPCDILFVGEAPGFSEDVIGRPFVGKAGKLLDIIIKEADPDEDWDIAFTNLIACIPKENLNKKVMEPPEESIEACKDRLLEIIEICNPKLIVTVGKIADQYHHKWVNSGSEGVVTIIHPAAITRMNEMQKPLAIQRSVVTLSDAFDEIVPF